MQCDYCKKDDETVSMLFMETSNQVGMVRCCRTCEKTTRQDYLDRTGFQNIGDIEDYGDFTGRPESGKGAFLRALDSLTSIFK